MCDCRVVLGAAPRALLGREEGALLLLALLPLLPMLPHTAASAASAAYAGPTVYDAAAASDTAATIATKQRCIVFGSIVFRFPQLSTSPS